MNKFHYINLLVVSLKKQSQNFLQRYYKELGEICLKYIVTEDYDNEEDSLSKACCELIYLMSRCCEYNFLNLMIDYIGKNIQDCLTDITVLAKIIFMLVMAYLVSKLTKNFIKE